ncbi:replicative DNA helicase [Caballeronia udeis]|uniref:Replicative DNA helicase n=1 Tax=Caballeronia udeis TaxID=1232866 RepID=A0ABW8MXH6_9BURK
MNARQETLDRADAAQHSIEAEQSVLGSLLLDNRSFKRIADQLRDRDFYRRDHRLIYRQITQLINDGRAADAITVFEALQVAGNADDAGGLAYLNELAQNTPGAANIQRYAEIVADRARLRSLLAAADEIRAVALNRQGATVTSIIARALAKLQDIAAGGADRAPGEAVMLSCAADVTPEAIRWLWEGWLAAGKLSILAGDGGTGKTTLALGLAAVLTVSGQWPDGTPCHRPGNILIWSSEDDWKDTLVPRLKAAGADLTRCFYVEGVKLADGKTGAFDPARDVPLLDARLEEIGGASLLIIDPIVNAVSGDMHKANDVRRSLQAIVDFGARHKCAILGLSHFTKGTAGRSPLERVTGSQAFGALARVVLVAAKEEGNDRRVLARAKSNIAADTGGVAYGIEIVRIADGIVASQVVWGELIAGTAREILGEFEYNADDDAPESLSELERCRHLLSEWLRPWMSHPDIKRAAEANGVSFRTLERAKAAAIADGIPIRAEKRGRDWVWVDASYPEQAQENATPPGESTPPTVSTPVGGVETQAEQGFAVKSAKSAKYPRAPARPRAPGGVP